ncbi:hypothetical protein FB45DRAFT_922236 [Roridomyces roridus]|uniref:Uncharacterized protein n=1 Tax=Roridomyces roridus TaxID=1738132 RepID=A0AAD7BMU3_9AGAR|nr:hypothetical protein FB45DRAFT_922236 [Roridomyces roridus]
MPDAYGDDDGELLQSFVIPIGSVEGVRPGTEFAVYDPDGAVVATLVARTVRINEAVLTSEEYEPVVLPLGARAGVINWRNEDMVLQIYISPEFPYTTELFPLVHTDVPHRYMQVDSLEKAQLSLTHIGDGVVLLRWLAGAMARGPHSERRFTAAGVDWPSILDALSHFHYFLELTSGSTLTAFSLEMHRLLGEYPGRMPDRSGDNGGNLIQDGCVHLRSREDAKYGFTMRNSWYEELFPYLFYFNPIEYTIRRWFVPESAHRAPLTAAGTVVVGMGSEGAFSFTLPPGDTVESSSGFVKMFVSTVYLDLGWIEQRVSPFDDKFHDSGRLFSSREQLETGEGWNSLCVFLTMSNGESGS